jgi:hypothetical protein
LARLLVGGAKLGGDLRVGGHLLRFASFDRHGRAGYPVPSAPKQGTRWSDRCD